MKKALIVTLMLCSVTGAHARSAEYQRMLEALSNSSNGRVLVFAPSIFDKTLAENLRQTHLDSVRQTKVRLVTVQYYNFLPKSTILSLVIANIPVYEVQTPIKEGFIIVDNQGWKGVNLGRIANANVQPMTSSEINSMLSWFKQAISNNVRITQYEAYLRLSQVLK